MKLLQPLCYYNCLNILCTESGFLSSNTADSCLSCPQHDSLRQQFSSFTPATHFPSESVFWHPIKKKEILDVTLSWDPTFDAKGSWIGLLTGPVSEAGGETVVAKVSLMFAHIPKKKQWEPMEQDNYINRIRWKLENAPIIQLSPDISWLLKKRNDS